MAKIKNIAVTTCENCDECAYIGEGDFCCLKFSEPVIVLTDFSTPTDNYLYCEKEKKQ